LDYWHTHYPPVRRLFRTLQSDSTSSYKIYKAFANQCVGVMALILQFWYCL